MKSITGLICKSKFLFGSKRVVNMKPIKVLFQAQPAKQITKNQQTQIKSLPLGAIPEGWETMSFDKLCSLPSSVLNRISIQIKKTKMNANEDLFEPISQITDPNQLPPYWVQIYKTFCNMQSIPQSKYKQLTCKPYLTQMFFSDLADEQMLKTVEKFVNNIHDYKELEGIAEPSFCKYLLSLKRELSMQGLNLQSFLDNKQKQVKINKILSFEYEFWVDVKHNRAKNGEQGNFFVQKKNIENPNTTLLISEKWPRIDVTYITRKRRRKDYEMCFVVKSLIQITVDGERHIIKLESKGPSSTNPQSDFKYSYAVIDYDGIFNGNPTLKPIFQF